MEALGVGEVCELCGNSNGGRKPMSLARLKVSSRLHATAELPLR